MNGEFNSYCSQYYELTQLLTKQQDRLKQLLADALPYTGQTKLDELDAIIHCNRKIQRVKTKAENTEDDIRAIERIILLIMRYFEIPPGTKLTGEITEKLEYEIWADENDMLCINKTKDLEPVVDAANIVTIRFSSILDDDDDDE